MVEGWERTEVGDRRSEVRKEQRRQNETEKNGAGMLERWKSGIMEELEKPKRPGYLS
jgi:hypothetical protein